MKKWNILGILVSSIPGFLHACMFTATNTTERIQLVGTVNTEVFGETIVHLLYWSAGLTSLVGIWYTCTVTTNSDTEYIHRTQDRRPKFRSRVGYDK